MAALHDLVQAGKARYVGVSDTPAWKVAQAQMIAQFRGWSPFIGLQIEYSLLERTVEGELIPMALELGLGVTPWSPLGGGRLTGKYTRQNSGNVKDGRAQLMAGRLDDKTYAVVEALARIADELHTTIARVALAWLQPQPGVSSIIFGARTVAHLEDNLKSLDVHLTPEQMTALDQLTTPQLPFPIGFLRMAPMLHHGGTTVNREPSGPHPFIPKTREDHY